MEPSSVASENNSREVQNDTIIHNDVTNAEKNVTSIADKHFETSTNSETKHVPQTSLECINSIVPDTVRSLTLNQIDRKDEILEDSVKIATGDAASKSLRIGNLHQQTNSDVSIERNTGIPEKIQMENGSQMVESVENKSTSTFLHSSASSITSTQSLSKVSAIVDDAMEHESIVNEKMEECKIQKVIETTEVSPNSNNQTDIGMSSMMTEQYCMQNFHSSSNEILSITLLQNEQSIATIAQSSKDDELVIDEQMTVDNVLTHESHLQKAIKTNPVLLHTNEQNDVEMSSPMVKSSDIQLPASGEFQKSALTIEKKLPKSTEICNTITVKTDEKSVNGKPTKKQPTQMPLTSLSVIASAYDTSDSESEDEVNCVYEAKNNRLNANEMEVQITKEYRNKTADTSDEESDSDDSSSSSAVSSSSSEEENGESDGSDENGTGSKKAKKTNEKNRRYRGSQEKESKGEFDNLPPIEDLKISVPEVLCDPLGEVGWMVEQMVVVRPKPGKPTLNLDTILFVERGRRVLGRIFDVFGQVSEPHYCVRFNSSDHIKESDIKVGMTVYFCPNTEYTSVVFLQDLLKMKVADELGDDEHPEFSDDEEERAYYAALKKKENTEKSNSSSEVPQKRQRTATQEPAWKSNHPWNSGRKQQSPGKNYNAPDWSGGQQQNACHTPNMWHYPSAYPNNQWPHGPQSYQGNAWPAACPQNAYGYSGQYGNRHPRGNARPFFRPPQSFHSGNNPYIQNGPYAQQSNPLRYPTANFPWRSQSPRQPGVTWPVAPPPPPPPPGM